MIFIKKGTLNAEKNKFPALIAKALICASLLSSSIGYASDSEDSFYSFQSAATVGTPSYSQIDIADVLNKPFDLSRPRNRETVRVLSLEGGGTRGMIEAQFLSLLEKKTNKHITELFDFIGGTSIGGVLAAAVTTPANPDADPRDWRPKYSATYLAENFKTLAPQLFEKNWWSLWGLLGPVYKVSTLAKVLENKFGNVTFDKSIRPTFITSYDLDSQESKFFKSWKTKEIFYTSDIATATACGPTYFKPYSVSPVNASASKRGYSLVDGGAYINMPTECLMVEIQKLFPHAKKVEIVSVGTGAYRLPFSGASLRSAGVIGWAKPAKNLLVANQTNLTNYLMKKKWGQSFSNWSPVISYAQSYLDDVNPQHMDYLKDATTEMVVERQKEFDQLAARLTSII